jgi:hypothetical protein
MFLNRILVCKITALFWKHRLLTAKKVQIITFNDNYKGLVKKCRNFARFNIISVLLW